MSEPRLVTVYCVFADEAEARRIGVGGVSDGPGRTGEGNESVGKLG